MSFDNARAREKLDKINPQVCPRDRRDVRVQNYARVNPPGKIGAAPAGFLKLRNNVRLHIACLGNFEWALNLDSQATPRRFP